MVLHNQYVFSILSDCPCVNLSILHYQLCVYLYTLNGTTNKCFRYTPPRMINYLK